MKQLIILLAVIGSMPLFAQNSASFELGNGLDFRLNDGDYRFTLGGMMQPYVAFEKEGDNPVDYILSSRRTYFSISGEAVKQKVSFFIQTDFSTKTLLLDAWVAYHPSERITIAFGQKQSLANNREMLAMEDKLTYPDRSLLSTIYSMTGREFGLFLDARLGGDRFGIVPQVAITSGDGMNSFGIDSRDPDMGGLKFAGRLDIFPFGFFTEGNDEAIADLMHEDKLKVALGGAASYNHGASESVGEGHGDFMLYNLTGGTMLPDYRQLYYDLLLKFKGFSLLGEYVIATATDLEGSFVNELGSDALAPTEISEYLALGRGYNAQIGYATKSGVGIDVRYAAVMPEFEENGLSVVSETSAITFGLTRYFKGNGLKLQATITSMTLSDDTNVLSGGLLFQVVL